MKYGAMNFPVNPVLDEIEVIAQLGFDYLELAMDPPMAHYTVVASSQVEIRRVLHDFGMGIVCHLPTFVSTADLAKGIRDASVQEMRRSLEVAAELGATKVVLHPSRVSGMGTFVVKTVVSFYNDFLAEIAAVASEAGMTICLENMFPSNLMGVEPEDFRESFAAFPSLMLTLDTGHANIEDWRGSRLMRLVEMFGERIGHLHFSDNNGSRDEHLPVGKGNINFKKLVRTLKRVGYDDTLTLEVFDSNRRKLVSSRKKIEALFSAC